jgi:hypothetical protein
VTQGHTRVTVVCGFGQHSVFPRGGILRIRLGAIDEIAKSYNRKHDFARTAAFGVLSGIGLAWRSVLALPERVHHRVSSLLGSTSNKEEMPCGDL